MPALIGAVWRDVDPPTEDMLEKALPEGVVQPGGRVTGIIHFEPVDRDAGRVAFEFDLVDGGDANVFGSASIPLETSRA